MNNLPYNKIIIILSVILIPLLVFAIVFSYRNIKVNIDNQVNNQVADQNLSWNIVQVQDGEVDVYLQGPQTSKVIAVELDVSFDTKHIKISGVEAGGFFADPIKVKFDDKKLAYSLMINPDNKVGNDLTKPILKFHLTPKVLAGQNFTALPESQVYLRGIGGAFPKESQIIAK